MTDIYLLTERRRKTIERMKQSLIGVAGLSDKEVLERLGGKEKVSQMVQFLADLFDSAWFTVVLMDTGNAEESGEYPEEITFETEFGTDVEVQDKQSETDKWTVRALDSVGGKAFFIRIRRNGLAERLDNLEGEEVPEELLEDIREAYTPKFGLDNFSYISQTDFLILAYIRSQLEKLLDGDRKEVSLTDMSIPVLKGTPWPVSLAEKTFSVWKRATPGQEEFCLDEELARAGTIVSLDSSALDAEEEFRKITKRLDNVDGRVIKVLASASMYLRRNNQKAGRIGYKTLYKLTSGLTPDQEDWKKRLTGKQLANLHDRLLKLKMTIATIKSDIIRDKFGKEWQFNQTRSLAEIIPTALRSTDGRNVHDGFVQVTDVLPLNVQFAMELGQIGYLPVKAMHGDYKLSPDTCCLADWWLDQIVHMGHYQHGRNVEEGRNMNKVRRWETFFKACGVKEKKRTWAKEFSKARFEEWKASGIIQDFQVFPDKVEITVSPSQEETQIEPVNVPKGRRTSANKWEKSANKWE